ncbi:MAG: cytidine deaminase [Clostridiales bacterium]|jgi:cytidine deaminase|nr:cytidine deaminase [Clostridiales bacterium]
MIEETVRKLIESARAARESAYAPYSRFSVGAALMADDGDVYQGSNVENLSFGLTVCAERVALFSAVAAGKRDFTGLALVTDTPEPVTPCGACRQVLHEFAPDLWVVSANLRGQHKLFTLRELLPYSFDTDLSK